MIRAALLMGGLTLAAAALADQVEYSPDGVRACRAEIPEVCPGIRLGGGRMVRCLRENVARLSEACARGIAAPGESSSADASGSLTIEVRNIRSSTGVVWLTLDDDAATFPRGRLRLLATPAVQGNVTAVFHGLPPGSYAFVAYHDENDNGRLDNQADGQHLEGFAFSNDVPGLDAAKSMVKVSGNAKAAVRLEYWLPPTAASSSGGQRAPGAAR